ncbi:hypothetical protein HYPBUDRAFT_153014 [Hyphopichia burtonii NRRL Y-1933]|uniref:CCA tRNA nucleotidyltransferase, mitochondrial n=1 Tax=Hyphopichia burtonii NRRL Y-1933 TaxID=984485 RepID=A0A1E4RJ14_9ASCO|nr:hypothetical protein HYPBUDRAFT_153014 [Hyphopichia burtonii NRRL Y-1933]ODV67085.1 hypothetical protein HYPBUDRAFT_153014 [Hyphopichia burtonii NRRL Y-1933]
MNNLLKYCIKKPAHQLSKTVTRDICTSLKISFAPPALRYYSMKRSIKDKINLNETETNIRNVLVKFCDYHNSLPDTDPSKKLELRITGGWVRDKLLGKESHDIDIAINFLSGEEFASLLYDYLVEHYPELELKGLHKIKKNPEKSKHLETCTTKLYGLDIDFVNLRNEQYTSESRVPIIECGTAEEDALRRDATLNALFYNLNKNIIEDFTGKGLEDLHNGILRTPLQPLQTFLDDPLRVLRLIRFASKFDFTIEEETLNAMKSPELKSTLIHKISRERVGVEIEKVLTSDNAQYGLNLIKFVDLTESIFNTGTIYESIQQSNDATVISDLSEKSSRLSSRVETSTVLKPVFDSIIESNRFSHFSPLYSNLFQDDHLKKLFWLAVILQPFGSLEVKVNPKKQNFFQIVDIILKEGLKYGKHDSDTISGIIKESVTSYQVLSDFFDNGANIQRSKLGVYLRNFGQYSPLNLIFNCFNDIIKKVIVSPSPDQQAPYPRPDLFPFSEADLNTIKSTIQEYDSLIKYIHDQALAEVDKLKPVLDGKTISKSLDKKPGPWMKSITHEVLVWQLDHPTGSQDECLQHIKQYLSTQL